MNKIHIYPIDETSVKWCIVNEVLPKKLRGTFIIKTWFDYSDYTLISILTSTGKSIQIKILGKDMLKLSRSAKLRGLMDNEEKQLKIEHKKILNEKRLESLRNLSKK